MAEIVVTAPIANPGPLGLFSFGMTTCVLSAVNLGWLPEAAMPVLVPLALGYGGFAQLLAGFFEFKNGSTFGATAFTSYGFFWVWFALVQWTVATGLIKVPVQTIPVMVGAILLLWAIFTLMMWLATFRANKTLCLLFLLLTITFFLLAAANFGHPTGKIGGGFGLATGIIAFLAAFADLMNAMARRTLIPLGEPFFKS